MDAERLVSEDSRAFPSEAAANREMQSMITGGAVELVRLREDLPEAGRIRERIDAICAIAEERKSRMEPGQVADLTHSADLLVTEEKAVMHSLKMQLRSKSSEEAREDLLARRKSRIPAEPEPMVAPEPAVSLPIPDCGQQLELIDLCQEETHEPFPPQPLITSNSLKTFCS